MSELKNIERTVALAADFVRATWQQHVMGAALIPGVREIKHNINLREKYAYSIVDALTRVNLPRLGRFERNIIALSQIALDIENGKASWDMKPMLLGGPNVKISKSGSKFNTVPFRYGTPKKDTANQRFAGILPKDIMKQAKKLKRGKRLTGTELKHPPRANKTTGQAHRSGLYEGLSRVKKATATTGKYMTLRRVSDNSPEGSWVHPGYEAHNIVEGVGTYCGPFVEKMIMDAAVMDIVDLKQVSVGMHIGVR
ncbi:hypothetical protein KAR91_83170 [Candidatus Pacearchaeota archaeon]|nr:hypothetical protein [Candidatus Pacearchaeota archaeon]